MFGILVQQCTAQLQAHIASSDYPGRLFSRELEELVPGIKVWTDWMICHSDLWNPPPAVRDPNMGPEIDVWSRTAELCNILKEMDTSGVKLLAERKDCKSNEPPHGKTNNLHMRKQRRRSASR